MESPQSMAKVIKVEGHPKSVIAVWDDAKGDALKQVTLKDVADWHMPTVMQTMGWLLLDNDKGITIASERCLDEGDDTYRTTTFIPRSLLRSVTEFKLATPKKRVKKAAPEPAPQPSE